MHKHEYTAQNKLKNFSIIIYGRENIDFEPNILIWDFDEFTFFEVR